MRIASVFLSSCLLASMATFASASPVGTSVTGGLMFNGVPTNYFNSSNGFVPATGYGNSGTGSTTVTIGSEIEFGYQDTANTDTADFTATGLTISDVPAGSQDNAPVVFTFSDPSFTGFALGADSFPGLTYSYAGTTLTIDIAAFNTTAGVTDSATFTYAAAVAPTPEPSSLLLLGTGVMGVAGAVRRKLLARR